MVDEAELEAVLEVDDAVANIVGRLDQEGQRVAVVEAGLPRPWAASLTRWLPF